jgi:hypothetical protein
VIDVNIDSINQYIEALRLGVKPATHYTDANPGIVRSA